MSEHIIAPKTQLTDAQRHQLTNHPEFIAEFDKNMGDAQFPSDEIPADFRQWLDNCLPNIPYTAMGMIAMDIYKQICFSDPKDMPLGIIQKCIDIVFNSKPTDHDCTMDYYCTIIEKCGKMMDKVTDIVAPARDKAVETIWVREKLKSDQLTPSAAIKLNKKM
jgi:hypothetical protein